MYCWLLSFRGKACSGMHENDNCKRSCSRFTNEAEKGTMNRFFFSQFPFAIFDLYFSSLHALSQLSEAPIGYPSSEPNYSQLVNNWSFGRFNKSSVKRIQDSDSGNWRVGHGLWLFGLVLSTVQFFKVCACFVFFACESENCKVHECFHFSPDDSQEREVISGSRCWNTGRDLVLRINQTSLCSEAVMTAS